MITEMLPIFRCQKEQKHFSDISQKKLKTKTAFSKMQHFLKQHFKEQVRISTFQKTAF